MKTRFLIALICLPAFAGALFAQPSPGAQPFGLKDDRLGESLQEFRARHDRTLIGDEPILHRKKRLPQCTGDKVDFKTRFETLSSAVIPDEKEERAGIVKCIASVTREDDPDFNDEPTVAGIRVYGRFIIFFTTACT
jgi:hypothetical protein